MTRSRATLAGFGAIGLWALLALLTVAAGPVPPFQLTAMCFALAAALGFGWTAAAGAGLARLRGLPPAVWAVGVGGLFGYHALYFTALGLAPAAQASLVAYLWPVLIVLFAALLPGERLRAGQVLGAALAFAGAWLVVLGPETGFARGHLPGLAAAAACALVWSGYSVLSRRLGDAPTQSVAVSCLATAALAALAHLALEETVWPADAAAWAAVAALGAGPVGLAFYLWDLGCKRGDIQLLGVAAYAAPLVSTILLIAVGFAEPAPGLVAAALLIAGGALIAARSGRRAPAAPQPRPAPGATAGSAAPAPPAARSLPSGGASSP
jgi:drug/metabolite transporter (DMT)-like permease